MPSLSTTGINLHYARLWQLLRRLVDVLKRFALYQDIAGQGNAMQHDHDGRSPSSIRL